MKWTNYLAMFIILMGLHACAGQQNDKTTKEKKDIDVNATMAKSPAADPSPKVPVLFQKVLEMNNARIGNSGQVVLVTNEFITQKEVTIHTFEKSNGQWGTKFAKTHGTIGYKGFAPYKQKREGDKRTPSGVFFLGPVYTYPNVTVETKMAHWVATANDYWIDDVNSDQYNRWVTSTRDPKDDHVSREEMLRKQDGKYKYGINVQYNMDQVKGLGSVITLHVLQGQKPTVGCIAVPEEDLIDIIGWLDPVQKPLIIMGGEEELVTGSVSGPGMDENDKYVWKKEKYAPPAN